MTELFEVKDFQDDLRDVLEELNYEAATRPGEGPEIEGLFLSAAQKIQEAMEILEKAIEIMKT